MNAFFCRMNGRDDRSERSSRRFDHRNGNPAHQVARVFVEIFDRRLAVDPRQHQAGQQGGRAQFQPEAVTGGKVRDPFGEESLRLVEQAGADRGQVDGFQHEVIEAEGGVESGVAEPGAFGIEQHRLAGVNVDEDVLGADIAMNQGKFRPGGDRQHGEDAVADVRMSFGRMPKIGVEPQRIEKPVGIEGALVGDLHERRGVDAAQGRGDGDCHIGVGPAGQKLGFPQPVILRAQEVQERDAARPILAQHARHIAGDDFRGAAQPGDFILIALERRLPVAGDLEFGERALGASVAAIGQRHLDDVGGDAAGQRLDGKARIGQAGRAQHRRQHGVPTVLMHCLSTPRLED